MRPGTRVGPDDGERLIARVSRIPARTATGWTVAKVQCGATGSRLAGQRTATVVGVMPNLKPGDIIDAKGRWDRHAKHGRQFRVAEHLIISAAAKGETGVSRPTDEAVARSHAILASRLIPGVGRRTADRIAATFGRNLPVILSSSPERLVEVRGIGTETARRIGESYRELRDLRLAVLFCQEREEPASMAIRRLRGMQPG